MDSLPPTLPETTITNISNKKSNSHDSNNDTVYQCQECQQSLPRSKFAKKLFSTSKNPRHEQNSSSALVLPKKLICKQCQKTITAKRCHQPPPKKIKQGRISSSGTIRRPNNFGYCAYIDRVFSLRCFRDIVDLQVFQSAKDISESFCALNAALRHGKNLPYKDILCLVIGDGVTPRTAVLVAFLTKGWDCISIDPALKSKWTDSTLSPVQNMIGYAGTLENFVLDPTTDQIPFSASPNHNQTPNKNKWKHIVMLCVHSHARFRGHATVAKIRAKFGKLPTTIVSLPCCPKFRHVHDIGIPPHVKYDDDCVFSACRSVDVWNFGCRPKIQPPPTSQTYCGIIQE